MNARELLDAYASEYKVTRGEREVHAPEAFAALRAVLDRHREFKIYDECGHQHREEEPGVMFIENVGLTCEDGYEYSICRECCTGGSGEYQTEGCASAQPHGGCWPCATEQAITAALETALTPSE